MTPEEKEYRKLRAEALLSDALLIEAFDAIEKDGIEQILASTALNAEGERERQYLILRVSVIRDLRSRLKTVIALGKAPVHRVA